MMVARTRAQYMAIGPLTYGEVAKLVGEVDTETIADILRTGASYSAIEEAVLWASGNADLLGAQGRALSGPAARVYDILTSDLQFAE